MAEPAAPAAHLRTPAEAGSGRTAEAGGDEDAGAGKEGRGKRAPAAGSRTRRVGPAKRWHPPEPCRGGPCGAALPRAWIYRRRQVERSGKRALLGNRVRSGTGCLGQPQER